MHYVIACYSKYSVRIDCATEREAVANFREQVAREDLVIVVCYIAGELYNSYNSRS